MANRWGPCLGLALALAAGCGEDPGNGGGGGGGGGRCLGADDPLVASCVYDDGSCTEFRGGIEPDEARVECADPAFPGTYREVECPAATRASGGCVEPLGGGSAVFFDSSIPAADFESLCDQFGGCYFTP